MMETRTHSQSHTHRRKRVGGQGVGTIDTLLIIMASL